MNIRRNSAFIVAITADNYIITGKRSDNFQLELPGGGYEISEKSPVSAVAREALEEVNLTVNKKKLELIGILGQRIVINPAVYYGKSKKLKKKPVLEQGYIMLYKINLKKNKDELSRILKPSGKPQEPIGVEFLTLTEVLNDNTSRIMLGHRRMICYVFFKHLQKRHGWLGRLKDPVNTGTHEI